MKSAYLVVAMLLGATQGALYSDPQHYMSDEQLALEDLSIFTTEDLENLNVEEAIKMIEDNKVNRAHSQLRMKNVKHIEHRMNVWEEKVALLEEMQALVEQNGAEFKEELLGDVQESEDQIKRMMKYDIESFIAKENAITEFEAKKEAEQYAQLSWAEKFDKKIDDLETQVEPMMA